MNGRYEEVSAPGFSVRHRDGAEVVVIRPRLRIGAALYLLVWLGFWLAGGGYAITLQWDRHDPALVLSMAATAIGVTSGLLPLAWLLTGREIIRVTPSGLTVSYGIAGWHRSRMFRSGEVRNLTSDAPRQEGERGTIVVPFFGGYRSGSVKFSYGARTIYLAGDLDESEGRLLASHLREVLRSSAAGR